MKNLRKVAATNSSNIASAAATDNATVACAARCALKGIQGYNANAAARWLKFYDKATAPTSADTPVKRIYLPASTPFAIEFDFVFERGLSYRLVTGVLDNDNTAVTAADILGLNVDYAI